METIVLDGKKLSDEILSEIADHVTSFIAQGNPPPHLAAVLVGEDGASETYVSSKIKNCERVGFKSTLIRKTSQITEKELLDIIHALNQDASIDGYIVQLPLPKHISEKAITEAIAPQKDVDGFHPVNVGNLALGLDTYISATPNGVMEILKRYKISTKGKQAVVLGRSNIVGSPMALLLSKSGSSELLSSNGYEGDATVTLCHSKTQDLKNITRQADILVVAIGQPQFVKADMVKPGAVVIDVGIHRIPDASKKSGFRLVGDVDYDQVAPLCNHITPVPGGVGLMTICSLLSNTFKAALKRKK